MPRKINCRRAVEIFQEQAVEKALDEYVDLELRLNGYRAKRDSSPGNSTG